MVLPQNLLIQNSEFSAQQRNISLSTTTAENVKTLQLLPHERSFIINFRLAMKEGIFSASLALEMGHASKPEVPHYCACTLGSSGRVKQFLIENESGNGVMLVGAFCRFTLRCSARIFVQEVFHALKWPRGPFDGGGIQVISTKKSLTIIIFKRISRMGG